MRVGFVSTFPPIECGIATYTQYLTDALRQKNTDVYVVCHWGGAGRQVFPAFDYEDPDLAERIFSTMVRFTPDVVHIQHEFGLYGKNFGANLIPALIQFRLVGIPVVTTLHTVYEKMPPQHAILLENLIQNSDRVVVSEAYQRDALQRILSPELMGRVVVIPHGAREVDPVPDARCRLALPERKKVILMIGYFRPNKNFERIIDLFPEIKKQVPEAILVLAGKIRGKEFREYRNILFEKIRRSPERESIWLIRGQLPQAVFDTILSAADVAVLPYKVNSQSGILAHCLAFGLPVVVSDVISLRGPVERSQAGRVARTDREFVNHVVEILQDAALHQRLSENARQYVRNHISWLKVAEQHLTLYRQLIEIPDVSSHVVLVD